MSDFPILATGAAGFIGVHVAGRLLKQGHRVVGIDSLNDYYDPALKDGRLEILCKDSRFRDVGFRPSTSLEDGIHRFAAWYCRYHRVN